MQIKDRIKELRRVKASELIPNPKNWRTHPVAQQDALRGVLAEVGYADALIARETPEGLMLVDGHLRAETTPDSEVPVLVLDINEAEADLVLATLDPLAAMAGRDEERLDELLSTVTSDNDTVNALLQTLADGYEPLTIPEPDPPDEGFDVGDALDDVESDDYEPIVKRGEIWSLGQHRLMCGDATSEGSVIALMDGKAAHAVLTDPPYGIDATTQTLGTGIKQFYRGKWDNDRPSVAFISRLAPLQIIWGGNYYTDELEPTNDWLCWHKKNDGLSFSEFELAWTNLGKNTRILSHHWAGELKAHPTQKPLPVIEWCMGLVDGLVIDPFVGSGTTIIAAERLGRRCYAMEIEPRYCDVAIKRWEDYTGEKAVKV